MVYREFQGKQLSMLGFGAMRLPTHPNGSVDEEAVRVATENIRKNSLDGSIAVMKGDLMAGIGYRPDVIVANLMADLVMMLSPAAEAQLDTGGIYITSGILDLKEETVADAVRAAGFDIIEIMHDGEWRCIVAVKRQ